MSRNISIVNEFDSLQSFPFYTGKFHQQENITFLMISHPIILIFIRISKMKYKYEIKTNGLKFGYLDGISSKSVPESKYTNEKNFSPIEYATITILG